MSILCDSGVWLAAFDRDDRFHDAANGFFTAARAGDVAALDLTLYEVANVAVCRWRAVHLAATAIELVERVTAGTVIRWNPELLALAAELGYAHRLSVYDAAYVAAAQTLDWTLVSTDIRDLVEPGFAISPDQVVI